MLTLQTDSITYGADMGGEFIAVHTNRAKDILPQMEQGKRYTVEIKEYSEKRSNNANRLLWSILSQCAEILHTDKEELYRNYIPKVGQYRDWDLPEDRVNTFRHAWESQGTGWVTERVDYAWNGDLVTVRAYYGSSTFSKKRMSYMIDMVVQDAKELGVDCMTEKERSLLIDKWEPVKV